VEVKILKDAITLNDVVNIMGMKMMLLLWEK